MGKVSSFKFYFVLLGQLTIIYLIDMLNHSLDKCDGNDTSKLILSEWTHKKHIPSFLSSMCKWGVLIQKLEGKFSVFEKVKASSHRTSFYSVKWYSNTRDTIALIIAEVNWIMKGKHKGRNSISRWVTISECVFRWVKISEELPFTYRVQHSRNCSKLCRITAFLLSRSLFTDRVTGWRN